MKLLCCPYILCDNKGRSGTISRKKSYRISSIRQCGYSLHISVWLLFEGGVYFIGKHADINHGWIRYVRAIQQRLLDAGTQPLSSAVSHGKEWYNTKSPSASPVTVVVRNVCVLLRLLFEGRVYFVRKPRDINDGQQVRAS